MLVGLGAGGRVGAGAGGATGAGWGGAGGRNGGVAGGAAVKGGTAGLGGAMGAGGTMTPGGAAEMVMRGAAAGSAGFFPKVFGSGTPITGCALGGSIAGVSTAGLGTMGGGVVGRNSAALGRGISNDFNVSLTGANTARSKLNSIFFAISSSTLSRAFISAKKFFRATKPANTSLIKVASLLA